MKPSQIISAVNACLDARTPVMLWGAAGVGKSDSIFQIGAKRKVEVRDVRLSNLDPTDIKGFPSPDAKRGVMTWLPADFLPTTGKGILFFDELNLADKMTQASAYQLFLTRQVGNYKLPAGWDIVAAGNTEKDRANITRMAGPLANRMIHLDFEADVPEWVVHAQANGISDELRAFIRFKPALLHSFDAQSKEPAFPSPRSWFFMDKLLKQPDLSPTVRDGLMAGTVGTGASVELRAFLDHIKDLPDIDDIVARPDQAPVPSKISAQYALVTMMASNTTPKNFGAMLKYVARFGSQEMEVLYARDAGNAVTALRATPEYRDWAVRNADVVLP